MTDYLGKLVKRGQAAGPFLRPRPIARFETPAVPMAELDPGLINLQGNAPEGNRPKPGPSTDSPKTGHPSADLPRSADEVQALRTIVVPPESASAIPAKTTARAPAPADRGTEPVNGQGLSRGEGPLPFDAETPEVVSQIRPSKVRVSPEPVDLKENRPGRERHLGQPAEPDINVTIGKVEIQAVSPPEGKRVVPRKAPSPRLTLDDYLEKRKA